MSGPLTSAAFLLIQLTLLLYPAQHLEAKPFSSSRAGRNLDGSGGVLRFRRELRDSLPYEAQMMSYPQVAGMEGQGSELLYQPEGWRGQGLGQGIGQALQRLVDDDRRRDQEAAYLAGLLRLLSEGEANVQRPGKAEDEEEEEGELQGPYPPDYDETEQGISMTKPQASWQGLLDPQLTQALLNRYRQDRLLQAGLAPSGSRVLESRGDTGAPERDEEVLRYLVGRVLSSLASDAQQNSPPRLSKRDLGAVSSVVASKRSRRSVDSIPLQMPSSEPSLLRVKRLGEEEDKMAGGPAAGVHRVAQVGLQRMKRIDNDLPQGKLVRKRRALTYDPSELAQRILQYLPE